MSERKVVFDLHDSLVTLPNYPSWNAEWLPGRVDLLKKLRLSSWGIIVWTSESVDAIIEGTKTLTPALLGLASMSLADEYYGGGKLPPIPVDFNPHYPDDVMIEHMQIWESKIDIKNMAVDGVKYPNQTEFFLAVERHKLLIDMHMGQKVPPLVGSNILVDNLVDDPFYPGYNAGLKKFASQLNFHLVDPKSKDEDMNNEHWIERMYRIITELA